MEGDLTLPEFPGRIFRAHVTNTADLVDPTSRSLLTELQIPNESGELLPGAYVQITFKFAGNSPYLTIPENTLIFQREGAAVGVVDANGKVEIRKIVINRDSGTKLEISNGLPSRPSDSRSIRQLSKWHDGEDRAGKFGGEAVRKYERI